MNVAILGAGNIACKMAEAINGLDDSVRAYAVASRDLEKAQRFREKWGFEKAYGSYEQMLSDPEVDLVYVATPHSFHLSHARRCIDFGKPVLLEKPMTVSADQARELFAYAEEKNVFITEAIWPRYMPSREIIRQLLDSGVIGTPHMIMADLSYPISHVPRMTTPALAGGSLLDIGIYCLNFASMVFGDDIADIRGTCTYCDTGVDCQDSITLTYRDGRIAVLTCSMMAASHRMGIVYGSRGYLHCTNINNVEKIEVFDQDHALVQTVQVPPQINGYEYELLACRRELARGGKACEEMPHEETIRMLQWMDKLRADWGIRYPFE